VVNDRQDPYGRQGEIYGYDEYGRPLYRQAPETPGYDYDPYAAGRQPYDQPSYDQQSPFDQPSFEQPPAYDQRAPGYDQPPPYGQQPSDYGRQPGYDRPSYEQPAPGYGGPQPPGEAIDDGHEDRVELNGAALPATERPLRADRAASPCRVHPARIAEVRQGVHVAAPAVAPGGGLFPHQPRLDADVHGPFSRAVLIELVRDEILHQ
jgi:hypothetical protein